MQILETINSKTLVRWLIIAGVLAFSLIAYRLAQTFPLFLWVGGAGALVFSALLMWGYALEMAGWYWRTHGWG